MNPFVPLRKEQEITIIQYLQVCREGVLMQGELPHPDHPKLSVIIPLFNEEKYFTLALRTAENQTLREVEIIVVDDGSTDNTPNLLKRYQKEDPRIKVIRHDKNRGSMYSRISAALQSKGEYVIFINARDALTHPNALTNIYNHAQSKKAEIIHYQACGGAFDGVRTFGLPYLFFTFNPNTIDKIINQPELRDNYFARQKHCTGSTFVFDKAYSRKLIQRMADALGKNVWEENVSRTDDLILAFTAMRTAESFCMVNETAYWHWLQFEQEKKQKKEYVGVFGDKFKEPEKLKKKLGEVIFSKKVIFNLTDDDPQAGEVRMVMLRDMESPEMAFTLNRLGLLDSLMELYKRELHWSYANEDAKNSCVEGAKKLLHYSDILRNKYNEFYDDEIFELKDSDGKKQNKKEEDKKEESKK